MPILGGMPAPRLPPQAINTIQTVAPAPQPVPVMPIGGGMQPDPMAGLATPGQIDSQRGIAEMLLQSSQEPVTSVWGGLGGIAEALAGGALAKKAGDREAAVADADRASKAGTAQREGQLMAMILAGENPDPALVQSVLSDPNANRGSIMEMLKPKPGEGYTLSPGQQRFDANGNPVAGVPAEAPEDPTSVQEYNFAKTHGYTGTYDQFLKDNGGGTNVEVNTTETADAAEAKALGAERVKFYSNIASDLPAADSLAQSVGRLDQLLSQVDPGSTSAVVDWVRSNTGLELTDDAGKLQAVQSLIDYLTPRMRVPGSGATSDMEMRTFRNSLPNLMGTPEGNRLVTQTMQALTQRRVDMAMIAQDYLNKSITADEATNRMRSLSDPFAAFKEAKKEPVAPEPPAMSPDGVPSIKDDAQYNALPSGTEFIDPDGVRRRKP